MKAPDIGALDCGLKVKQYINATKSKNKINILQKIYTSDAALIAMTQIIFNLEACNHTVVF